MPLNNAPVINIKTFGKGKGRARCVSQEKMKKAWLMNKAWSKLNIFSNLQEGEEKGALKNIKYRISGKKGVIKEKNNVKI